MMADELASLIATLELWLEKNIIVIVSSQWIIRSPKDGCEEEGKINSVHEMDKED